MVLVSVTFAEAKLLDGVRAVVQDRPILFSDVTNRVRAVKQSPALASILSVSASDFNEERALTLLIEEKIILSAAKDMGAEPSESEVNKQVSVIATQNRLSVENLKKSLKAEKIDFDLYKSNIAIQLAKRAVIEKELRASASGQSDQELRNYYERNTPEELHIFAIKKPSSKSNVQALGSLRSRILKSGASDAILKTNKAVDLGWSDPGTLNESFQQAIASAGTNATATAPFVYNRAAYILAIKGRRKGTADNFDTAKEQIRQQMQSKDLEERFKTWVEQKKKNLNIVVNNV